MIKTGLAPLGIAVMIAVAATHSIAAEQVNCEEFYVTRNGDTIENIAQRAYAAPMAILIAARNKITTSERQQLPAGTGLVLPCLHNLAQYTPQLRYLVMADVAVVATE